MTISNNIQPSNRYTFAWTGSGLGISSFSVYGAGDLTRLCVRYEATDWQKSRSSYNDADWQRDVVSAINLLVDDCGGRPVPQEVVDAFNAWRLVNYEHNRAEIDAQPERYGMVDWANDPVFKRPAIVRGAQYQIRKNRPETGVDWWKYGCVGLGWRINGAADLEALTVA